MKLVRERIADGRVLKLVEAFLKQGVLAQCETMEGYEMKEIEEMEAGTPQGGVICQLCYEKVAGCLRFAPAARSPPTSTSTRWTGRWTGKAARWCAALTTW